MAYYLATDPIGQNSLLPPPSAEGIAADRRRAAIFQFSRTGRERVYANLSTAADLARISVPLAVNAAGMITGSENARQTVLNGIGDAPTAGLLQQIETDVAALIANAPQVISLNGSPVVTAALANTSSQSKPGNSNVYPTMPDRAPLYVKGIGYLTAPTGSSPGRNVTAVFQGPVRSKTVRESQPGLPGCGLSGFSPVWGDAYAGCSQPGESQQTNAGWWLVAGAVGIGLYFSQKKKRGRK